MPNGGVWTTYLPIRAASNELTLPLLLASAAINWFPVNRTMPAACCATLAASNDVMPFWPVVFVGVTVYEPAPKPVSVYVPPGKVDIADTFVEPAPLSSTFETKRGFGEPIALP